MPDVIEAITVDAPAKVPVDVVAHEADLNDFETYQAAKKGDWKPPVKETEKAAETVKTESEAPTEKQANEEEKPSTDAEAKADSESGTEQTETTQEKPEGGKRKQTAAERIKEIADERNFVRQENAKLKTRLEELEKLPQAAAIPDTGEPKRPIRPRLDDPKLDTTEKYETAMDKYEEDLGKFDDFRRQKTGREEAVQREETALEARLHQTLKKAAEDKRFGEEFNPYMSPQDGGPATSALMVQIMKRLEDPAAIVHYLQQNKGFAQSIHDVFSDKDTSKASQLQRDTVLYQLARLDGVFVGIANAAKSAKAAESPTKETKPPEKTVTTKPAQKPPIILTGGGEPPTKNLDEADDFESYQRMKKAGARLQN